MQPITSGIVVDQFAQFLSEYFGSILSVLFY